MRQSLLTITDYDAALRGEIRGWIGHEPDDDELKVFEQAVADYIADRINENKHVDLNGICAAILDCKQDNFHQCDECGDYFLPAAFNDACIGNFCLNCKPYRDPDNEPGGWDDLIACGEIG